MLSLVMGTEMAIAAEDLPLLKEISPGIYRGAQPTEEGYRKLKAMSIKTVINFRHEPNVIAQGKEWTEAEGMNYISIPWTIFGPLDVGTIQRFFEVIEDPAKQPVFFHCRRGVERTGLMGAFYYIRYENLSAEEAYAKAFNGYPLKLIWKPFVKTKLEKFKDAVKKN